jgi:hypothetical protein
MDDLTRAKALVQGVLDLCYDTYEGRGITARPSPPWKLVLDRCERFLGAHGEVTPEELEAALPGLAALMATEDLIARRGSYWETQPTEDNS